MFLNLAATVACTEVEGPGRRAALWTQGCVKRCPGCCNPHMLPIRPARIVAVDAVVAWVEQARDEHDIEGITLLGGEPLLQAKGLARLVAACRSLGLSVMAFTGYTRCEIDQLGWDGVDELLAAVDVLVMGPFDVTRRDEVRNWVGSSNQEFWYLTRAYDNGIETDVRFSAALEVRVGGRGEVRVGGFPVARFVGTS